VTDEAELPDGDDPQATGDPPADGDRSAAAPPATPREPRPMIERIGLAAVALVLALLFGGIAAAAWIGGEPFLTAMGAIGCLMTVWVGALTLVRG
jgi:hypothetical protein